MKVWLWLGLSKVFIGCYFFSFSHLEEDFQVFPNIVTLQYLSSLRIFRVWTDCCSFSWYKIHSWFHQLRKQKANHHTTIISVHQPFWDHVNWNEWSVLFSHQCAFCLQTLLWIHFSHFSLRLILTEARWCLQFFCSWLYFGLLDLSLMCSWSNFPFLWRFAAVPPEAFSPLWIMAPTVV